MVGALGQGNVRKLDASVQLGALPILTSLTT